MIPPLKDIYESTILDKPIKNLALELHLIQKKHKLTLNNLIAMTNYVFVALLKHENMENK